MVVDWPLRGRARDLATLVALLEDGRSVVLHGDAGVGKSRLAAEAATVVAAAERRPARRITGTPGGAVPLAAVGGLLGPSPAADAVAGVAATLAAGLGTAVLHVDDAHDLDDASATVLHQLLERGDVRMVATRRTGEPLRPPVQALLSSAALARIQVEPLDLDQVGELVAAALGGPVEGGTVRRLTDVSRGNPLFLRELVEGSRASSTLEQLSGMWRLTGGAESTPLLDDLLGTRLAPLGAASREALEVVALAGELGLGLLGAVAEPAVVEDLERIGLLVARDDGHDVQVTLVHPLYAERLQAALPATARRRLSRALAVASDGHPAGSVGDELRAVIWHLDGDVPVATDRLVDAARAAFAVGDTAVTARLAAAAFHGGGGTVTALLASWCLGEIGREADGAALLAEAVAAATDDRELAFLTIRQSEMEWWHEQRTDAAQALLDRAAGRSAIGADFAGAQRAVFAALDGDADGAVRHGAALVEHPDPWVDSTAALALGLADVFAGRVEDGAARAAATYDRVQQAPEGAMNGDPGVHVVARAFNLVQAGALGEADQLARLVYEVAVAQPGRQARAWGAMLRGEVALARGLPLDAQRWFVEAEVGWADGGLPGPARWSAVGCALAAALTGRGADVEAILARSAGYDVTGFGLWERRRDRAVLWGAHLTGDGSVPARAAEVVAAARAVGADQMAFEVVHDLCRMGHPDDAVRLLDDGVLQGRRNPVVRTLIAAAGSGDAVALGNAADELAELGYLLDGAETAAMAARAHRRAGRARAAERAAARSGALAARCPGAATPALAERRSTTLISARELQVARLAAGGMSNRAIAQHLIVSERTVENHLYRAFTKLGVGSRDDLAAALPPEG